MNGLKAHWPTIFATIIGTAIITLQQAGIVMPVWLVSIAAALLPVGANVVHRKPWPSDAPAPEPMTTHITIPPKGDQSMAAKLTRHP